MYDLIITIVHSLNHSPEHVGRMDHSPLDKQVELAVSGDILKPLSQLYDTIAPNVVLAEIPGDPPEIKGG